MVLLHILRESALYKTYKYRELVVEIVRRVSSNHFHTACEFLPSIIVTFHNIRFACCDNHAGGYAVLYVLCGMVVAVIDDVLLGCIH